MKNILVTGACGFIGSHIVEKLVKNGFNVTAVAYYNPLNSNGWLDSLDKKILKNIKISFLHDLEEIILYFDEEQLEKVFFNLLTNAIKFTPQNGIVEVKAEIENKLLKVTVEDSGIGMTQQSQEKLFRIDVNHTTLGTNQEKGTGLGLILCKEFEKAAHENKFIEKTTQCLIIIKLNCYMINFLR